MGEGADQRVCSTDVVCANLRCEHVTELRIGRVAKSEHVYSSPCGRLHVMNSIPVACCLLPRKPPCLANIPPSQGYPIALFQFTLSHNLGCSICKGRQLQKRRGASLCHLAPRSQMIRQMVRQPAVILRLRPQRDCWTCRLTVLPKVIHSLSQSILDLAYHSTRSYGAEKSCFNSVHNTFVIGIGPNYIVNVASSLDSDHIDNTQCLTTHVPELPIPRCLGT
ncbi:kinase-like domain [Pyrenophora seminiperda CCB06]|uniref:Kinase-like domain n=1 Tax=Pyrenophora seminiperda CCB06 TaxID=1302712 RepID=A0A3M7M4L6_9PLEO|nr:kinase-like domain [Pyrenophora seminiperda CCB06]